MWDLYSNSKESIAIETSYEKLKNVLPERTFLGLVKYIDYKNDYIPDGNTYYPFVHKRKSFTHENEVRAIIQELPKKEGEKEIFDIKNELNGISIKIDLNELIEVIHISPVAESWFEELVVDISRKHGLNAKIRKSDLYNDPVC
jgi:predicted ATPase